MGVINVSLPMYYVFLMDGNMASFRDIINIFANSVPNGNPMGAQST